MMLFSKLFPNSDFTDKQKKAIQYLLYATISDGASQVLVTLQETIAINAVKATAFDITLLGIITNATLFFSFFISSLITLKNRKKWIIFGYILGRGIFIFAFLITKSWIFMFFLFMYYSLFSLQSPLINGFYEEFAGKYKGIVFGIGRTLLLFVSMILSLIAGKLMDVSISFYYIILFSVSISAAVTYFYYYKIAQLGETLSIPKLGISVFSHLKEILSNKSFIVFEINFMLYGFAFMIMVPAVPIFLLNYLALTNFEMAQARGLYAQIFMIVLFPLAGKLYDKINPWLLGIISFIILVFYPLNMLISFYLKSKAFAFLSLSIYSLGLIGITMLWNLGSIMFAGKNNSIYYQGFHVSLTGIRGLLGPLLGYVLMQGFGVQFNFIISSVLFLSAAISHYIYAKNKDLM